MKDAFSAMGIVIGSRLPGRPIMAYTRKGHLRWLPWWMRRALVAGWNWCVCHLMGHDHILKGIEHPYVCVDCCTVLGP